MERLIYGAREKRLDAAALARFQEQLKKNKNVEWRGDYFDGHSFEYNGDRGVFCKSSECKSSSDYRLAFNGNHINFFGNYCFNHSILILKEKLLSSINSSSSNIGPWPLGLTEASEHWGKRIWEEERADDTSQLIKWMTRIPIDYHDRVNL